MEAIRPDRSVFTRTGAWHTGLLLVTLCLSVAACNEGWSAILKASFSAQSSGPGLMAFAAGSYLFWLRREWLLTPGSGSLASLMLLLFSAVAYYYGIEQRIDVLVNCAAIVFTFSLICSLLQDGAIRKLAPAVIALLFAVPVPGLITDMVSVPMQLFDAAVVESIGQAVGLPVSRTGTLIAINGITVDIDQGCDGLRLVWPMLLAAYTASTISRVPRWLQITICLSAIPVALILNCIRLIITTIMYGYASQENAALVHDALGWLMIISAGFLPLVLLSPYIERSFRSVSDHPNVTLDRQKNIRPGHLFPIGASVAVVLMTTTGPLSSQELNLADSELVQSRISALPYRLERWIGEDRSVPEREREILNADALVQRVYHEPDTNSQLVVLVAYHRDGRLASGHRAPTCYRTRGWEVVRKEPFNWSGEDNNLAGDIYVMSRNNSRMTVFEIFSKPILSSADGLIPDKVISSHSLMRIQFLVSGEQDYGHSVKQSIGQFLSKLTSPLTTT